MCVLEVGFFSDTEESLSGARDSRKQSRTCNVLWPAGLDRFAIWMDPSLSLSAESIRIEVYGEDRTNAKEVLRVGKEEITDASCLCRHDLS